jgi:guanine deaminase
MTGKCLMDQNAPDGVRDETEQSLIDTEALIQRWHGVDRLGYAITPRFVPSCSEAQLRGAGELAAKYPDVWIQSHVAENKDEIAWVNRCTPMPAATLPCTSSSACCARAPCTRTASTSTTKTAR